MTLRVTQSMLFQSTLANIQRNSRNLSVLQERLASGQRLNRPSDDPAGILRLMPLQVALGKLELHKESISLATETLNTGAAALQDASELMIDARTLALQGMNGSLNASDRRSLAQEVDQVLQSMLGLANASHGGRYLFGGTEILAAPFELLAGAGGERVVYRGNGARIQVEVGPGLKSPVNLPGESVFMAIQRGETRFQGTTGARAGSGTDSARGMGTLLVRHTGSSLAGAPAGVALGAASAEGDTLLGAGHTITVTGSGPNFQFSVNGGPPVDYATTGAATDLVLEDPSGGKVHLTLTGFAGPAGAFTLDSSFKLSTDGGASWTEVTVPPAAQSNVQVLDSATGLVTNVDASGIRAVGDERLLYEGTFDVFSTLIALRDALAGEGGLSAEALGQDLQTLLGEVDRAHEMLLDGVRELGGRVSRLELVQNRVEGMVVSTQDVIGDVRDIDLAETILEMTQQETLFQASLAVGARVVQPTLLDFLS